ncbi:craniofacial development protein 2-like [Cylas formicarius]|uniref:craniofacial development protein 2-like n=1 Tax=Cylas formicarius TaxID=197179 RepID=UPI002958DA6E|nr:craniofacial development protein 2-like [Cylas formicarius]
MSETKKKGHGTEDIDGHLHMWSGINKENRAKAGVSVLINKKWKKTITSWEPINEHIITVHLKMCGRSIVLLGVYGPTNDSPATEKITFFETLKEEIEKVKTKQEILIAGDFNGRTGNKAHNKTVGHFGEDTINDNGERLIEICELNDLKITNGFYKHKDIHKYTWIQETRNLRSIIDYIVVRITTTIKIQDVRVKRSAECGTDHRLVVAYMHFPWYGVAKKNKEEIAKQEQQKGNQNNQEIKEKRFKIHLLEKETIRDLYRRRLDEKLIEFNFNNLTDTYEHVKKSIKEAAYEALGEEDGKNKKYTEELSLLPLFAKALYATRSRFYTETFQCAAIFRTSYLRLPTTHMFAAGFGTIGPSNDRSAQLGILTTNKLSY